MFQFTRSGIPPPHTLEEFNGHNLKVLVYQKKIMIQGSGLNNPNEIIKTLISKFDNCPFIKLEEKYTEDLQKILPKKSGLLCMSCNSINNFINLSIEEETPMLKFDNCNCEAKLRSLSINIISNRILPDFSVIFSDSLIRLFKLGFFKGYTLIFPEFIFDICDKELIGKKRRNKLDEFISSCIELQNKDFINLLNFQENEIIQFQEINSSNFNEIEDKIMLELSNITNSLLITTDINLHHRASIKKMPHIFIPGSIESKLKFLTRE